MFLHPCIEESGVADMGDDPYDDEEDLEEAMLLNKATYIKSFLLVPCGFFDEDIDDFNPELN